MKVERVTIHALRIPMEPHRTASGTLTVSPVVAVEIAAAGVTGQALGFAYTEAALGPMARLAEAFGEQIIGEAVAPSALSDGIAAKCRLLGTQGLVGMAIAAIDMALWDLKARAAGEALAVLLGGAPRPVRAYGNLGYEAPREAGQGAERLAKAGFRGIKSKIGHPTLAEDLAVIAAMRSAAGPDVALMVDYNQSLDADEAERRLRVLAGEGLAWVEEPVVSHDWTTLARLGRETGAPVMAGENWWGPQDFANAFAAGVATRAMPDAGKVGGVTGWLRVAGLAAGQGLRLSSHLWPELSAHLLAATSPSGWLEYADWWNPVLREPLRLDRGMTSIGETMGSGMELDPAAVARFSA